MIFALAHITAGCLSALSTKYEKTLAWIGFIGFEVYEIGQYFEKGDYPIQETEEFMIGLFFGICLLLLFAGSKKAHKALKQR